MTDKIPRAAVVGGSLIAFAGDVPESAREDIYLSSMYAQQATRAAINDGLSGDWFTYYRNTLRFIGWDIPAPQRLSPVRGDSVAMQATESISTRLGKSFSSPIADALAALERDALAIELFEKTSVSNDVGYFQMIPCVPKGQNRVEMGIYHREFQIQRSVSRFLFIKNEKLIHSSVEQIAVITFNTLYYAEFREKVKKAVLSHSMKYLKGLEI